jgi:hypothetical protein
MFVEKCVMTTDNPQSKMIIFPEVESKIAVIRNLEVIADADVADLFGVPTREVNRVVTNNPEKFKFGYSFY